MYWISTLITKQLHSVFEGRGCHQQQDGNAFSSYRHGQGYKISPGWVEHNGVIDFPRKSCVVQKPEKTPVSW